MHFNTLIRLVTTTGRAFLLCIALLALGTFLLWSSGRTWVDKIDRGVVRAYTSYHSRPLDEAMRIRHADPDKALKKLKKLIHHLASIQKLDRLDPLKRRTYQTLIQVLQERGELENALVWIEEWLKFDANDLNAQVGKADLLWRIPARKKDGIAQIEHLYRKLPEAEIIAKKYLEFLVAEGELSKAFLVANRFPVTVESIVKDDWYIFWDSGSGFRAQQQLKAIPRFDPQGHIEIAFDLPPDTKALRLDPPPFSRLLLLRPELTIQNDAPKGPMRLWELPLRLNHMEHTGEQVTTTGEGDPYLIWDMPSSRTGVGKAVFRCGIRNSFQALLSTLAASPKAQAIEQELRAAGEDAAVEELRALREEMTGRKDR